MMGPGPAWGSAPILLAAAAPSESLNIFEPASPPAAAIASLFVLVLAITGAILLVVWGVLLYCVARFRRRDEGEAAEPPQVYGSYPIEVAWTAFPALVVFILLLVLVRAINEVQVDEDLPSENAAPLRVRVVGRQWWWEYVYEEYAGRKLGFTTANELHVPASDAAAERPVFLRLESADVCHSFWVPRLAGKVDLIPGRTNRLWFQPSAPGLYLGQCAEYCGTQHAHMLLRVVVDTPEDLEEWLAGQQAPAAEDPAAAEGRRLFLGQSCVSCHTVRGTPAKGTYAPDLTHLMSRQTLASGTIDNTRENLRRWVDDPQQVKPGSLMPAFRLDEASLDRIVDYLMTLK